MRPVVAAVRFMLAHAWATDKRRLLVASALMTVGYLSSPLVGVALGALTDAVIATETSVALTLAAVLALLLVSEMLMGHFGHLSVVELSDMQQLHLTDEVTRLSHGSTSLADLENPAHVRLLTSVTEGLQRVRVALEASLQLGGTLFQILVTTAIMGLVDPWLLLLPAAALPPVWFADRAQQVLDRARDASADDIRLARHLLSVGTSAATAKEVRLFAAQDLLATRHAGAWDRTTATLWSAHRRSALLRACGQAWFALAYGAALFIVVRGAATGDIAIGQVVLVVTLAIQISSQVAGALGLFGALQGAGRTVEQIDELRAAVAHERQAEGNAAAPAVLAGGLRVRDLTFSYAGSSRPVLDGVNLDLPAGKTIALVGGNGAGKSTLVKLLCGLYRPSSGSVQVDGVELSAISRDDWQSRVATLFQDFARLELTLRENVGIGHLPAMDDDAQIGRALDEARARHLAERSPQGLDQVLGTSYDDGRQLSGGQWQSLGLGRTVLRPDPLLVVLDEPASALDAAAEHALFERFSATARRTSSQTGAVTVYVSHRFSTVRDADLIVVLEGGRVVETGTHDELVAIDGAYAAMYGLQARAYR
ncbi:ABC transporter ATP-binding protein [Oerskovia enterophila]